MSRVVVVGATGRIGTYLVPRLVDGGHEVIAVSRGTRGKSGIKVVAIDEKLFRRAARGALR